MSAEIETLHRPFEKWLRAEGIPFVRARSDRESTIAAGHPDFTLLAQGRVLLIEFKDKDGGKVSKEQEDRAEELEKAGCKVHILRDLGVAIELTQAWRSTLGSILISEAPKQTANLVRFGAAIFERDPSGRLAHVRIATPADSSIPVLAA